VIGMKLFMNWLVGDALAWGCNAWGNMWIWCEIMIMVWDRRNFMSLVGRFHSGVVVYKIR